MNENLVLSGEIEMDETYIGGKPRKENRKDDKDKKPSKKVPVVGMVERKGRVTAFVSNGKRLNANYLNGLIKKNVNTEDSKLYTDEWAGYNKVKKFMPHAVIKHAFQYVDKEVHTNTIEGFWGLFKRGIIGQYHKISVKFMSMYIDEFCWRYNNRKNDNIFKDLLYNTLLC